MNNSFSRVVYLRVSRFATLQRIFRRSLTADRVLAEIGDNAKWLKEFYVLLSFSFVFGKID